MVITHKIPPNRIIESDHKNKPRDIPELNFKKLYFEHLDGNCEECCFCEWELEDDNKQFSKDMEELREKGNE